MPQKVLLDFEKADINAAKIAFPEAEVKGCYFHLCQSLIRKISNVGLRIPYETDVNIKLKLKSLAALAFVPISDVRVIFDHLSTTFPDEESYNEVLTYFFTTYIEGAAGREPQFPMRLWNHYEAALERSPKTTNCCEVQAMEFSRTQKGKEVLIYSGFEYLKFRTVNGVVTWRCRRHRSTRCHSFLKTKDGSIMKEPTEHCHDSCPQKVIANAARSQMREDMKSVAATPRNVIGNVLSGLSNDVLACFPKQSSLTRNLLHHRKEGYLPNPSNTNFEIPEKYINLVLYDSGADDINRILVLGDKELLAELKKDSIYGDGTFDKVPSMFYQLYTWHAKVGNSYPPCVYILLPKKDLGTYNRMFEIIKVLLPNMMPQKVLLDFEKAAINAAKIAFPEADVKGCYFHLCQSLIRKISNVGLRIPYETDVNIKLKLKSLAALAFVPISDVRVIFDQLSTTFPDEESYNEVLTYFFTTYIEGAAGREPQFPMRLWNHYEAALERSPKTTNCCEGFHNSLNSLFHCSHPSIWFLFDGLQRDLACQRLLLSNAQAGRLEIKKKKI
ncbi:hypothetical protein X975_17494, partial [Stegodyphus mimosarum]